MSCIKNPKKFLWIKYEGDHNYRPISVWKFMDCCDDFCARFKCTLCGCEDTRHFIEWEELQRWGLPNDVIKNIGTIRWWADESLTITNNPPVTTNQ